MDRFGKEYSWSVMVQKDSDVLVNLDYVPDSNTYPNEKSELFCIASISKAITAVGIMKLVEEKKINLDDEINTYFEGIPEDKAQIKVRDLLVHKSGLLQSYPIQGISNDDKAFNAIMKEKLAPDKGAEFHYSNQNYQLLAFIIEKVSGLKYSSFIQQNVLIPLKMDHTIPWEEAGKDDPIAEIGRRIQRSIGRKNWGYMGSSGFFSNSADLLNFWNGINSGVLISQESRNLLLQSHLTRPSGLGIGFGFYNYQETKWESSEIWTRGSESWGHNAVIRHFPEKDLTIIVLSNSGEMGNSSQTGNRLISDYILEFLFH